MSSQEQPFESFYLLFKDAREVKDLLPDDFVVHRSNGNIESEWKIVDHAIGKGKTMFDKDVEWRIKISNGVHVKHVPVDLLVSWNKKE
jgi:hypothetical protein